MIDGVEIVVRRGSVYLSAGDCERYFSGIDAVILLKQERDLLIMPVRHAAGGGYLLKLRNAAGDRVVAAGDFFRDRGIADHVPIRANAVWSEDRGALVGANIFENVNKVCSLSKEL